MVWFMGYS